MDTLVLNAHYQPVGRVSWQQAFRLIFTGRAEVVENYADRVVRSARDAWPVPSIVRFLRKVAKMPFRRKVIFNRRNVYLRDRGRCQYCGVVVPSTEFEFEHVVPRAQGGRTAWDNIVVACVRCNQRKGGRTPEQAGMRLMSQPRRPTSLPIKVPSGLIWREGMPTSWRDYLHSVRYWHAKLDSH
ncbi:MAG: HNH endonuclease [Acidobacteriota bacterium]